MIDTLRGEVATENGGTDVLAPMVMSWLGRVEECKRHKAPFNDVASQCMQFFSGAMGFMWNQDYVNKYMGGIKAPRFRITICKAFELVALYGPTLYWQNPVRVVKSRRKKAQIDMETLTGALGDDGAAMQIFQMLQQETLQTTSQRKVVTALLDEYLNYTPNEQPQGLAWHASSAITEALVKGRGCLWPMPYQPPGSNRVLTGSFYDSVDNLLIDPDATTLYDAKYIIKQETKPLRDWEEEYGLPKDSLRSAGSVESAWNQGGSRINDNAMMERRTGRQNDMLTAYKVWSKGGIGCHMDGPQQVYQPLAEALDKAVGRYAFLVVAPGVRFPLNAHPEWLRQATDEEAVKRLTWPIPYWMDNRWPVVPIDFYNRPNDPWAIAPLAPGLGELTFINVMMSAMAAKIYNTSRILIAGAESLGETIEAQIRDGEDLTYLKVPAHEGRLGDRIEMIKFPEVNSDVWEMIERTMYMFDRRTGITELMAGMTPGNKIARVAEDVRQRSTAQQIRPEYMATRVEDALSVASECEKLAAHSFVKPQHLDGLFGRSEQFLWERYISGEKLEFVVREFQATVVANSSRKPDRAKDMESFTQISQFFMPFLQQYAVQAGDFDTVNGIIRRWGEATDNNVDDMLINPEKMQQAQQQAQQAEQEQAQAQMQMEQQKAQLEMQKVQMQMQMKMQESQMQMQLKGQEAQAKLQMTGQEHQARLVMDGQQHQLTLAQQAQKLQSETTAAKARMAQDAASAVMGMRQDGAKHEQAMSQEDESHRQKLKLAEQTAKVQASLARQKARSQPKPKPAGASR